MSCVKGYSVSYLDNLYSNKNLGAKVAVVDNSGSRKTNFEEFVRIVNSYAHFLKNQGIKKSDVVAINLALSMEHYAFRYACHFIGAVFVSINPKLPQKRIESIINQSNAKLCVDSAMLDTIKIDEYPCQIDKNITDEDLGYIVFTSGTTNEPKGVIHSRSIYEVFYNLNVDYIENVRKNVINGCCEYAAMADSTFVLSVVDMMFLIFGETIHIIDSSMLINVDNLKNYIEENRINITITLPDLAEMLLPNKSLKVLCLAGQSSNYDFSKYDICVLNAYGASECPVMTLDYITDEVFVSKSLGNGQIFVNSENSEITYSGPGLFLKYINDESLTNEVLEHSDDKTIYHTHDIAKQIDDNKYQIVGRKDFVVKILGKRINLAEIESCIKQISIIKDVVVKLADDNENVIVAYYSTLNLQPAKEHEIVEAISATLPAYMLPHEYIFVENFSYNASGKVDRLSLHSNSAEKNSNFVAAQNETEKVLLKTVNKILLEKTPSIEIGTTDNLLKLGLNSLSAMAINSQLNNYNLFVPIDFMMLNPNIRSWANKILESNDNDEEQLALVKKQTENSNLFPITDTSIFFYDIINKHKFIMNHVKIFNLAAIIRFNGVESEKLVACIQKLFDVHAGLKTKIVLKDGRPHILKRENWHPNIDVVDISEKPNYKFFSKQTKPFNLLKDDLARVKIFHHENDYYVLFDVHHIITDGFSQQLLIDDLLKLLSGVEVQSEKANCFDIAMLFQQYLNSPAYKADYKYYEDLQKGVELIKYPRSKTGTKKFGNHVKFVFNEYDEKQVFDYCIKNSVSAPIFFISVLSKALIDLLGEHAFEIVSLYHARDKFYEQNTYACMFNAYPVVIKDLKSFEFEDILQYLGRQINESLKHKLLFKDSRSLIDKHDIMINYLYDYEKNDEIEMTLPNGIKYEQIIMNSKKMTQRASTPLTINVTGGFKKGVIQFGAKYNQSLFSYADMKKLVDKFKQIIDSAIY